MSSQYLIFFQIDFHIALFNFMFDNLTDFVKGKTVTYDGFVYLSVLTHSHSNTFKNII